MAANLDNPHEKIEALTSAFELFTKQAERLETAYEELKKQIDLTNQALEKSNAQLKAKLVELDALTYYHNSILNNISQGLLFIALSGGITTYNPAAEAILKIPVDRVLFHSFWSTFPDDAFGFSMREALSSCKETATTYTTYSIPGEESKELEVETNFVLRAASSGNRGMDSMQGMIVLIRDITEIRRLQMIATRHDRLEELGEMAAKVAHEIRNPLGGIKGFASLLKRDLESQPELQKLAGYILDGTDNLNRIVTSVLNYARPVKPALEQTDLNKLAKDLQEHISADATLPANIQLQVEMPEETLYAPADPRLLKSALLNLMVNAMQAMPEGGLLKCTFGKKEGKAVIQVSDTGIGIPTEHLEKIYSPFFTTRADGNGFGLSEVSKIVQAHGGTLHVDSKVGEGTTFTIKIPLKTKVKNGY